MTLTYRDTAGTLRATQSLSLAAGAGRLFGSDGAGLGGPFRGTVNVSADHSIQGHVLRLGHEPSGPPPTATATPTVTPTPADTATGTPTRTPTWTPTGEQYRHRHTHVHAHANAPTRTPTTADTPTSTPEPMTWTARQSGTAARWSTSTRSTRRRPGSSA